MEPHNPGTPAGGAPPQDRSSVEVLKIPGIFLIILGSLASLNSLYSIGTHLFATPEPRDLSELPPEVARLIEATLPYAPIVGVISLVLALLTLAGGIAIVRRRAYGLALAGAIASSIPCLHPCICLALPFGIWSLVLLLRPDVKDTFGPSGPGSGGSSGSGFTGAPPSSGPGFGTPPNTL